MAEDIVTSIIDFAESLGGEFRDREDREIFEFFEYFFVVFDEFEVGNNFIELKSCSEEPEKRFFHNVSLIIMKEYDIKLVLSRDYSMK